MNIKQKSLVAVGFFSLFGGTSLAQTPTYQAPTHQVQTSQSGADMRQIMKELGLNRSQMKALKKLSGETKAAQTEFERRDKEVKDLTNAGKLREAIFLGEVLAVDRAEYRQEREQKLAEILTSEQIAQLASLRQ